MHNDIYIIGYQSDQTEGYIVEVSISADGSISDSVLSKYKFNTGKCYHGLEPDLIRVTDNIFGVAFRSGSQAGTPHEGHLNTYKLNNYNPGGHSIPDGNRIIFKNDTYAIYANATHVAVKIRDHLISRELNLSASNWNHLVLTYDGSYIRFYCNGTEIITEYYNKGLERNTNEIKIGDNFFGYIDEVAIYARILSQASILTHYNNPGQQ
jgi:hypothetical protein